MIKKNKIRSFFLRDFWEKFAMTLIGLGIFMLMQPFFMVLFTYSFIVILTGTLLFIAAGHFPKE